MPVQSGGGWCEPRRRRATMSNLLQLMPEKCIEARRNRHTFLFLAAVFYFDYYACFERWFMSFKIQRIVAREGATHTHKRRSHRRAVLPVHTDVMMMVVTQKKTNKNCHTIDEEHQARIGPSLHSVIAVVMGIASVRIEIAFFTPNSLHVIRPHECSLRYLPVSGKWYVRCGEQIVVQWKHEWMQPHTGWCAHLSRLAPFFVCARLCGFDCVVLMHLVVR